jgi:hypothetical protein
MRLTYDVEDGVDRLEPSVTVNAEWQVAARLDTTEAHAIAEVMVCEVFLLHSEQLSTDVELDVREGGLRDSVWENIALWSIST